MQIEIKILWNKIRTIFICSLLKFKIQKKYFKLKLSKRLGLRHVIQHLKLISQANYPLNSGSSTFTTHRNQ